MRIPPALWLGIAACAVLLTSCQSPPSRPRVETSVSPSPLQSSADGTATLQKDADGFSKYQAITRGMDYPEVEKLMGGPGRYESGQYNWGSKSGDEPAVSVRFANGRVQRKHFGASYATLSVWSSGGGPDLSRLRGMNIVGMRLEQVRRIALVPDAPDYLFSADYNFKPLPGGTRRSQVVSQEVYWWGSMHVTVWDGVVHGVDNPN